ncbi:MAG: cupin fold metalloprotein, WbuC family [Alphaproteobacteria bacterium]|nr:cupin fold metalloprotein, WbuC family [Alphaproteobacteria bacterium]
MNIEKSEKSLGHTDALESTPEAEFKSGPFSIFGSVDMEYLKSRALMAPRKRYRICLHSNHSNLTQEMLICLVGFNYFHPHRHPGNRSESYHLIEGELDVYLFNEYGGVIQKIELSAPKSDVKCNKPFIYRVSGSVYHFTVPRSKLTIYHEVLSGPWDMNSIEYASFAPGENDRDGVRTFTEKVTGICLEKLTELS